MHIDNYINVILNCRFCFMCRHLSGIGNVTFTEADTPRVRASMLYGVTTGTIQLNNPDIISCIYRHDLSGVCRRNCVQHFDEIGLNLAARADIVEGGYAPENIKALADSLMQTAQWTVSGTGEVLYFVDPYTQEAANVTAAFAKIMQKAKVSYQTVSGGCIGKGLKILGYLDKAAAAAKQFAALVEKTGAKTVVVSNPAAYDALVNDFPALGIKLAAKIMHTSEYILSLALPCKNQQEVYYLESDFLRNYNDDLSAPHSLLQAVGAKNRLFGTNDEESYTCGEGAVVLPRIDASLVEKLAQYVEARADAPATDRILVASPYTKLMLGKYTSLNVQTLEEFVAEAL
ncbi:MAG: (Fe-S)-binding protein [Lentisphaerae bacterium]|nr:(Fe-S)-binding protein [Lentisphaerota bacterium]